MNKHISITNYMISCILITIVMCGCAGTTESDLPAAPNNIHTIKPLPTNMEDWQYIRVRNNDTLGFRGFKPLTESDNTFDGVYQVNVLEGWLPGGKDIGFGRLAGTRVRSVMFKCSEPSVMLFGTTVRDLKLNVIYEQPASGAMSLSRKTDVTIDEAISYICRNM